MRLSPSILVVDGNVDSRMVSAGLLCREGYHVCSVGTFQEAMGILSAGPPDLLITELRLGAFNGLHLVIRGRTEFPDMSAIVLTNNADPVHETEAKRYGAAYVLKPGGHTSLLTIVSQRLGLSADRRSSIRTSIPAHLDVKIAGHTLAALVDVSYTGFCLELPPDAVAGSFEIAVPVFGLSIRANTIWTSGALACPGVVRCGTVAAETGATARDLRGFVDLLTNTFPQASRQKGVLIRAAKPSM